MKKTEKIYDELERHRQRTVALLNSRTTPVVHWTVEYFWYSLQLICATRRNLASRTINISWMCHQGLSSIATLRVFGEFEGAWEWYGHGLTGYHELPDHKENSDDLNIQMAPTVSAGDPWSRHHSKMLPLLRHAATAHSITSRVVGQIQSSHDGKVFDTHGVSRLVGNLGKTSLRDFWSTTIGAAFW